MYQGPVLFGSEHSVGQFHCGSEPLDRWIVNRASANQLSGASRTWVVVEAVKGVAYYASASASIVRETAPKSMRRSQPEMLPAILLSRLAVDVEHQGRGLGKALLKHFVLKSLEVRERVGVRILLVHAKDEGAREFYTRFGFISSPFDALTLMQLLPGE